MKKERFKRPTDDQIINFAIVVNDGGLDTEMLTNMVTLSNMIIDRLYENGDILIPSSVEKEAQEELTDDRVMQSVQNTIGDSTKEMLAEIISWEKDLSEYESLESILRSKYFIFKKTDNE